MARIRFGSENYDLATLPTLPLEELAAIDLRVTFWGEKGEVDHETEIAELLSELSGNDPTTSHMSWEEARSAEAQYGQRSAMAGKLVELGEAGQIVVIAAFLTHEDWVSDACQEVLGHQAREGNARAFEAMSYACINFNDSRSEYSRKVLEALAAAGNEDAARTLAAKAKIEDLQA